MNKRIIWTVVGIVVVVLLFIFAGQPFKSKQQKTDESVKIGGAFILTGPSALIGQLQKDAATQAIEEINSRGGINGRKVELVLEDTASDPKTALSAYQALKLKGVKYIVADSSPVVSAIRPVAVQDGNLIFAAGATAPNYFDGSNLSCRIALTAKNFGPGYVELAKKKNYKNLVALLPDNEYGRGLSQEIEKSLIASGGKLIDTEFYDAGSTGGDYRTNITKLKAKQTEADALVIGQVANTVESMLKQISDLGWKKPILSDYYTVQNPALKNISLAEGIDHIDYQYSREAQVDESTIATAFKSKWAAAHNGSNPVYLAAGHYDVVNLIAEGISKAGDDPKKVADYISHLKNYKGVTGTFSFNDDCEVSRDMVFRTVRGGKIVGI